MANHGSLITALISQPRKVHLLLQALMALSQWQLTSILRVALLS
jgi:hypothetical protein